MPSMTTPAAIGEPLPFRAHAATATLPGLHTLDAIERIAAGVHEPLLGRLLDDHIQLCPQNRGTLDEAACEELRARWPSTRFRPHANVRVLPRLRLFDASSPLADAGHLFDAVATVCQRLQSPCYTLHAGYRVNASLPEMIDNVMRLQDRFPCPVGVEGLYPDPQRQQLMDCWSDYERVLCAGVPLAVDLSHLQIVARREGPCDDLVRALLSSPTTLEVHLSANDGRRDSHDVLRSEPWWWHLRDAIQPRATVFSEGNQLRAH